MVRIGPLSDEHRQMLEPVRRRAVGRVSQRAHMVLLSARGYPVEQIAEIFGVGEDVVRTWLHRYEQAEPLGLDDRPQPGRPPKDRLARHIVDAQAAIRRATTAWCTGAGRSGCWPRSWRPASGWSCRRRACGATCTRPAGAGP